MSDYGDDYSDYGDEWLYIEDEYMAADDLAEHVVASPPPTAYADDDDLPDWDRFDYFNDLEYASDGYDDAAFVPHDMKGAQVGQKRKRAVRSMRSKKRQRTAGDSLSSPRVSVAAYQPVVWRSQNDREPLRRILDKNAPSFALFKDWREKLADTPRWARGAAPDKPQSACAGEAHAGDESASTADNAEALDGAALADGEELENDEDDDADVNISQDALMAALQRQLSVAGGPLSGMDPQQLLQFAMRMATDKDAGDDIAGEMAEELLGGEEGEEDADTEENLLSWIAKQRNAERGDAGAEPKSPDAARDSKRPPTPPSSEANRSTKEGEHNKATEKKSKAWTAKEMRPTASLKRKADEEVEAEGSTKTTKKRATRSFDAPTAASQARNAPAPARATGATRNKR